MKKSKQKKNRISVWIVLCALCVMTMAALTGCGSGTSTNTSDNAGYRALPEEESLEYSADTISGSNGTDDTLVSETDLAGEEYATKLIRTVDMTLETTEFDTLIDTLRTRVGEMEGYVESSNVSTPGENENRWAYLTIRIPSDRLDEFLDVVGENANVIYSGESVEDVTLRYVDLETHVDELRTEQEVLESMLEQAESIDEILAIRSQLTEVRYEIESYESQLKVLENRVSYSTVYLSIDEVDRESQTAQDTFGQRVRARFSDSIYRLGQGLRNFAIAFLGLLPIILLWVVIAVVALLIVLGCVRHRRKKKRGKTSEKEETDPEEPNGSDES